MKKTITSKDNEKIKYLRQLQQKKYRNELGCFCVENLKIIYAALQANQFPESLFISSNLLDRQEKETLSIIEKNPNYFMIDEKTNRSFSSLEEPSGICAVYKKSPHELNITKPIIYLNAINDPGNLGSILRTALAFGYHNIMVDENCVDLYNPKTINAAKDAIFKLNLSHDNNLSFLKSIKGKITIITTRLENALDIQGYSTKNNFCLVLGSEAHGVDETVQKLSDEFLTIKMSSQMESLNVSVAAGIMLYLLKVSQQNQL